MTSKIDWNDVVFGIHDWSCLEDYQPEIVQLNFDWFEFLESDFVDKPIESVVSQIFYPEIENLCEERFGEKGEEAIEQDAQTVALALNKSGKYLTGKLSFEQQDCLLDVIEKIIDKNEDTLHSGDVQKLFNLYSTIEKFEPTHKIQKPTMESVENKNLEAFF